MRTIDELRVILKEKFSDVEILFLDDVLGHFHNLYHLHALTSDRLATLERCDSNLSTKLEDVLKLATYAESLAHRLAGQLHRQPDNGTAVETTEECDVVAIADRRHYFCKCGALRFSTRALPF